MKALPIILLAATLLFSAQTTFTVKEWMGVTRSHEAISGGIAFPKGAAPSISQLALFQGATEVPAQFQLLVPHTDGSVEWVLVDFTGDFTANEEKNYTLKVQAPTATPAQTVTVSRNNSVITINNGVIAASFDTVDFKGIESLVYNSKSMISGAGGLSVHDIVKGAPDTNGTVIRAGMVYSGPLRVTYRVEGEFYRGAVGGLGYSYMITLYAGSSKVIIDASIRNSINATAGRTAKIERAFASFKLGFDPSASISYDTIAGHRAGNYGWPNDTVRSTRAYEDNTGMGLVVTERWTGGSYDNFLSRTLRNGRSVEVDMIMPSTDASRYLTNYMVDTTTGNNPYVYCLPDMAHKNSRIVLECYSGALSSSGLREKMLSAKHRLVPRQAPADVSASGGLSLGKFGTLEDEVASHARWGWTAGNPVRIPYGPSANEATTQLVPATRPDACPSLDIGVHYDQECDYLQSWLLQWVRYGNRGFFDEGEASAYFYTAYWTYRTTDFEYDGQNAPQGWINSVRTTDQLGFDDVENREDIMGRPASAAGCHFFAIGLTDYYCLTGDPEALEACKDLYEAPKVYLLRWGGGSSGPVDSNNSFVDLSDRTTNRLLGYAIRMYDLTKDPAILPPIRNVVRAAMKSHYRDPYFWLKKPFYENPAHAVPFGQYKVSDSVRTYLRANRLAIQYVPYQPYSMMDSVSGETWTIYSSPYWMGSWLQDILENWLIIFPDDDDVRDELVGLANYYSQVMSGYCGLGTYSNVISDFPRKGMYSAGFYPDMDTLHFYKWESAHAACKQQPRGSFTRYHGTWDEALRPAAEVGGFRHTGHTYFLRQAEHSWSYTSIPYSALPPYAGAPLPENQPGMFARVGTGNWYGFERSDQLTKVVPLFYEAVHHTDTIPPEAVTDLSVSRLSGNAGLSFHWTAPAGDAVSYQLKVCKDKPLADYPDINYMDIDTTVIPWWYGKNVEGEPVPAGAGTPEGFDAAGTYSEDSVYYAAVCSRDSMSNLSRLSNIVRIDNTISIEKARGRGEVFGLACFPNPFNPAVCLKARVPSDYRKVVSIRIYNAAGRLVHSMDGSAKNGLFSVNWMAKDNAGRSLASGVYAVRMAAGGRELKQKVILIR